MFIIQGTMNCDEFITNFYLSEFMNDSKVLYKNARNSFRLAPRLSDFRLRGWDSEFRI